MRYSKLSRKVAITFFCLIPFQVVRVIDGDTIKGLARPWPGIVAEVSLRIRGIDTPEIRGKCLEEKALANAAKTYLEFLLPTDNIVVVRNIKRGKYAGRVIGDIPMIRDAMISAGYARKYSGGKRKPWC